MSEFTKEQLEEIANRFAAALPNVALPRDLYEKGWLVSRLALSLLERAENAENGIAVCLETIKALGANPPERMTPTEAAAAWAQEYVRRRLRAENAEAERDQARRELAEAEEAIQLLLSLPQCKPVTGDVVLCVACGQRKAPIGRDAPSILHLCDHECVGYKADPRPGFLWPGETLEDFGYPEEAARADGDLRGALKHPAVLRARERGGRG